MATFSELRTRLRNDVLVESDTGFFSDADLLDFLVEASVEIASLGGFPTATSSSAVASGAVTVAAPSDVSIIELREVTFNNLPLELTDAKNVRLYQEIGGIPRYYRYDPRAGGSIDLSPAANASGTLVIDYVQDLSSVTYSGGDEPWGGVLSDWHDAIVYFAGVKAFEKGFEYDKSQYWNQRLNLRLQPLAIYLGNDNVLNVGVTQNERG